MKTETEDQDTGKTEAIRKIEAMAESLLRKRDSAIQARAIDGCEARMRADQETYDNCLNDSDRGYTSLDYAADRVRPKQEDTSQGSQLTVNVVRGRTEVNSGRMISAVMPTDDRAWQLEITPDPEIEEQLSDTRMTSKATGQPIVDDKGKELSVRDIAVRKRAEAKKMMDGMQTRIDDQLTECDAHFEHMRGIETGARLGTCVIKGPFVMPVIESKYVKKTDQTGSVWERVSQEKLKPVLRAVDPWDCYPAPMWDGEDVKKLPYHWEKGTITPAEIRDLINSEVGSYIPEQLEKVLLSPPIRVSVGLEESKRVIEKKTLQFGEAYETWEFHGDVDQEALEAMGKTVKPTDRFQRAKVLFINDIPVDAALYPADNIPIIYNYWQWSKVAGSPFGSGIPRAGKWVQAVIQGAFRGMVDNAQNVSGGFLIVAGNEFEKIQQVGSIKVLQVPRDTNVRESFNFIQVTANQQTFQSIIELALRFLDLETTTPMAFQGDKISMPETLGATNILEDSGNAAIEHRGTLWEKKILTMTLKGFYDYNMLDPECPDDIKGDYNVAVSGVKRLQNRDLEAKMVENFMAMKNDPDFKYKKDWGKLLDRITKMYRLDIDRPESDIKADEERAAQEPPPQDPRLEAANINAQSRIEEAQINHQGDLKEIELKGQIAAMQQEFDKWKTEMDIYRDQIKMQADLQKSFEQIRAKLAESGEKINLQRELTKEKMGGQALTPPVEPGQKAAPGESYQE